jgi:N-acetylglutamate synthase-like GNAT family acetyltransferase
MKCTKFMCLFFSLSFTIMISKLISRFMRGILPGQSVEIINVEGQSVLIHFIKKEYIGCAKLTHTPASANLNIDQIHIEPRYRGQGFGVIFIRRCLDLLSSLSSSSLTTMTTTMSSTATRMGWRRSKCLHMV